jgi:hypothetical protein
MNPRKREELKNIKISIYPLEKERTFDPEPLFL